MPPKPKHAAKTGKTAKKSTHSSGFTFKKVAPSIVIDNGTTNVKTGMSNEDVPKVEIENLIGMTADKKQSFVGKRYKGKTGLTLNYPMKNGIIENFDQMEEVWEYSFKKLKESPGKFKVMVTESPINTLDNREEMAKVMFEKFGVEGMYIGIKPVLAMYAQGHLNGVAVCSGGRVTSATPVVSAATVKDTDVHMDLAGMQVTDYLMKLLQAKKQPVTAADWGAINDAKEDLCYVALDYEKELKTVKPAKYALPNGKSITLTTERIQAPEILFQPELIKSNYQSIQEAIHKAVTKAPRKDRGILLENVLLCGGNTMFQGMQERVKKEVKKLSGLSKVVVDAPLNRDISAWVGGASLANMPSFEAHWLSKREYEEKGDRIVKKFFP